MSLKVRIQDKADRLKLLLETYDELRRLVSKNLADYAESAKQKKKVYQEMEKTFAWLLKHRNTWQVLQMVGLQYENNLYPLKWKIEKKAKKNV